MPKTEVSPIAARLGDKLNRPLPEGVSSKVYRIRASDEVHAALAKFRSPKEIGEFIEGQLRAAGRLE